MDYEKAYKEALQRMKDIVVVPENEHGLQILKETVFPELAESEDDAFEFLKGQAIEWIASLEHDISQSIYDGVKGHSPEDERELARWKKALAWLEKQKEQKPYCGDDPTRYKQQTAEEQDYSGLTDLERAIHRGFLCAGIENVPVALIKETAQECIAWSAVAESRAKHSEETLDDFTQNIRNLITDKLTYKDPNGSGISSTVFIDDNTAKDIANGILFYLGKEAVKNPDREVPEWSEEDRRILDEAIAMIESRGCWVRSDDAVKQVSDFLKSLRPQPHWKPSEEQMEALGYAIQIMSTDLSVKAAKASQELESIREQLKSL